MTKNESKNEINSLEWITAVCGSKSLTPAAKAAFVNLVGGSPVIIPNIPFCMDHPSEEMQYALFELARAGLAALSIDGHLYKISLTPFRLPL